MPTLSTTSQNQIRQKHQEVEFVGQPVGHEHGDATPTAAPGRAPRQPRAGDWILLNGPFNLVNINSVTFRVADAAAGRTAGSPLAAIEVHQDAPDGPMVMTANLVVDRRHGGVVRARRSRSRCPGRHDLYLVFQTVAGGSTGGNLFNLNWAEFNGQGIGVPAT